MHKARVKEGLKGDSTCFNTIASYHSSVYTVSKGHNQINL